MRNGVSVKSFPAPPYDRAEILRYAGCRGETDARLNALLDECIEESVSAFSYRVCYRELSVSEFFGIFGEESETAQRRLDGCERAVIFAATVGLGIDRLIAKYASVAPTKALLFQALGAERIESLCDAFCAELPSAGARFSAGYGDFPLEKQKIFFAALDCPRKIGLTLTEGGLMTPTKSVTAVVGLGKPKPCETGCSACGKRDCTLRKV